MKANIAGMIGPLNAAIADHQKNIQTYQMQEQQGQAEGLAVDNSGSIAAEERQIQQLKDEFLANENFFQVGNTVIITGPEQAEYVGTVESRELTDTDLIYHFGDGNEYAQSKLDSDGYESSLVANYEA